MSVRINKSTPISLRKLITSVQISQMIMTNVCSFSVTKFVIQYTCHIFSAL